MSSSPAPSRLPRFGNSKLPTVSSGSSIAIPLKRSNTRASDKKRTVTALRNPSTANGSLFLSRFQRKPPPTPPKPATPLTRSFSVATRTSPPSADKPLPNPPVAQVVPQESGRTLLDASEVPMPLRPLSPTRQSAQPASNPMWDIPQPPATTPDRTLQKRPSYHELKRKASQFIGLKVPTEEAAPPVPPIPAGFLSESPATWSTPVLPEEPSTPTPTPRSRLTAPTAVPRSRIGRSSSGCPEVAEPGSFKSKNSKTKGSGLGRPAGPPRSAGEAPPRSLLRDVSTSTGVVEEAPAILPHTSSLFPQTSAVPAPLSVASPRPTVAPSNPGRVRIPGVRIRTPYSVADIINAEQRHAAALALADGPQSPGGDSPASPTTVKSPTSSGPAVKDVDPVAVDEILPAATPSATLPRSHASPRHAAKASQASQKSHAAKKLAGAPSTTAPGSSRAVSGSHEDTLPKTPSPLRDALTLESDEEPDTWQQANASQLASPSCIEQSYAEFLRSIPVEQHAAVQGMMGRLQVMGAQRHEMENSALEAEKTAKTLRLRADTAQQAYTQLNRQLNELLGLC